MKLPAPTSILARHLVVFFSLACVLSACQTRRGGRKSADATSDSSDSVDATDAAADGTDGAPGTDSTDGTGVVDSADATDSIDATDAVDSSSTDVADSADAADAADSADSSDGLDAIDSSDGSDGADLDGTDAVDTDGSDGTDGPVEPKVTTIAIIQTSVDSTACDPTKIVNKPEVLQLTNAIVVGARFTAFEGDGSSEALDGYYIAEPGAGSGHGLSLVVPVSSGLSFNVGERVTLVGRHVEFYCFSQFHVDSATLTGEAAVPSPAVVSTATFSQPAKLEAYESSLIRLENVVVESVESFEAVVTGGAKIAGSNYKPGYFAKVGDTLDSVTGFLEFAFGEYRIQPRSIEDVVLDEPSSGVSMSITDIQADGSSVSCTTPGGISLPTQTNVATTGVVISPVHAASKSLNAVYISDSQAGSWSGLYVVFATDSGWSPSVGESVEVQGLVQEFYCLTEFVATSWKTLGFTNTPDPLLTATFALASSGFEEFEGTLVTLNDLVVTSTDNLEQYGELEVDGVLTVDGSDYGVVLGYSVDDTIGSATGVLTYGFGAWRLVPFFQSDVSP